MNRTALIAQIQQARETLERLLTLLQSATPERDRFVAHLKSGKQIERCVIASFRIAESMGFRANFANANTCSELDIERLNSRSILSAPC